jgi:C4-dicarboxylate transporter DctM subunit
LIGSPLFVILGATTALSLLFFTDLSHLTDLKVLIQHIENIATKQEFLAIPFFIASGAIMSSGGIARRLVELMRALFGFLPGGLAIAAVAACMFFAAVSGSSPVTLIAVGSMMVPALLKGGYPENFSLGLVTTAGSLGCLVPPSVSMLIYAISVSGSSSVDPSDLFLGGLIPAFLVAGLLAVYSFFVGLGIPGSRPKFSRVELKKKWVEGAWSVFLPIIVLGGIYGGWFTPSQAGAVAIAYSLFLTCVVHRELSLKEVMESLKEAGALIGSLIPIIVLAFGLNEFLALIEVQDHLLAWLKDLNPSAAQFMILTNVVLIVLGALMDSISATLVFAPLLAPLAQDLYGIDPIHFGIVFVVNMEIGYLMPPVATNLFVASAVFKKSFGQVSRAVMPTLGLTILALALVITIPTLSLGLVRMKQGKEAYVAFPWGGKSGQTTDATSGSAPPSLKSLTGKIVDDMRDVPEKPEGAAQ